jgi:hypothetical protein
LFTISAATAKTASPPMAKGEKAAK